MAVKTYPHTKKIEMQAAKSRWTRLENEKDNRKYEFILKWDLLEVKQMTQAIKTASWPSSAGPWTSASWPQSGRVARGRWGTRTGLSPGPGSRPIEARLGWRRRRRRCEDTKLRKCKSRDLNCKSFEFKVKLNKKGWRRSLKANISGRWPKWVKKA